MAALRSNYVAYLSAERVSYTYRADYASAAEREQRAPTGSLEETDLEVRKVPHTWCSLSRPKDGPQCDLIPGRGTSGGTASEEDGMVGLRNSRPAWLEHPGRASGKSKAGDWRKGQPLGC